MGGTLVPPFTVCWVGGKIPRDPIETFVVVSCPGKSGSSAVGIGMVDVGSLDRFLGLVLDRGWCDIPGLTDWGISASFFSDSIRVGGGPSITDMIYPQPIKTPRDKTKASSNLFSNRKISALFYGIGAAAMIGVAFK